MKFVRTGLLRFRKRYLARLDIFQQPRHVVAQCAHGLHTFGILRRFAGQPAVYAVPVLRRYDGHVVDSEILVQPVERRARTAAPADGYGCCRLEAEQLPCRVEEPVQNRAQGTGSGRRSRSVNRRQDRPLRPVFRAAYRTIRPERRSGRARRICCRRCSPARLSCRSRRSRS